MIRGNKGTNFGNIVAIFGAVLIALGFAWLIAQNWHQINDAVKILILLAVTIGAYTAGFILKEKRYVKTGKAVLALGAALYTLTIFLIAQIFNIDLSLQTTAWLLLLSVIGIVVTSYIFDSSIGLIIGLAEFLVWITLQFFAFEEKNRFLNPSIGILVLIFLSIGILLLGLSFIHRFLRHAFEKVYIWWTAFYFLLLIYVLSFQGLLPVLWENTKTSTQSLTLLIILSIISIATFAYGMIILSKKKAIKTWELTGSLSLIILTIAIILITIPVTNSIGTCNQKQCYDNHDKQSCDTDALNCAWQQDTGFGGYCQPESCGVFRSEASCENSTEFDCVWDKNYCMQKPCSLYNDKTSCEEISALAAPQEKIAGPYNGCEWVRLNNTNICRDKACFNYNDNAQACKDAGCYYETNTGGAPFCTEKYCYNLQDQASCESQENLSCAWTGNYCMDTFECNKYNNNHNACVNDNTCSWQSGYNFMNNKDVPASLWVVWTLINLIFIAVIIGIIFYGSLIGASKIINLGIIFFSLDIITRYIGFLIDYWGYTSLAVFFIIGGVLLLGGGYFIEKWRRELVQKARKKR